MKYLLAIIAMVCGTIIFTSYTSYKKETDGSFMSSLKSFGEDLQGSLIAETCSRELNAKIEKATELSASAEINFLQATTALREVLKNQKKTNCSEYVKKYSNKSGVEKYNAAYDKVSAITDNYAKAAGENWLVRTWNRYF